MSSSAWGLGYELDWINGKTFVFLYKTHKRSLVFFLVLPLGTSFQECSQDHNSKKEAFFLILMTISEEGGKIVFFRWEVQQHWDQWRWLDPTEGCCGRRGKINSHRCTSDGEWLPAPVRAIGIGLPNLMLLCVRWLLCAHQRFQKSLFWTYEGGLF